MPAECSIFLGQLPKKCKKVGKSGYEATEEFLCLLDRSGYWHVSNDIYLNWIRTYSIMIVKASTEHNALCFQVTWRPFCQVLSLQVVSLQGSKSVMHGCQWILYSPGKHPMPSSLSGYSVINWWIFVILSL